MPDILHDFQIEASARSVFDAVSTADGISAWWSLSTVGTPAAGARYELDFGPGYQWEALVTVCEPGRAFELDLTKADTDWLGTRVGFELKEDGARTNVRFHHTGWRSVGEHYRVSCYCWAMYLRILKRFVEHGEFVAYEDRLRA